MIDLCCSFRECPVEALGFLAASNGCNPQSTSGARRGTMSGIPWEIEFGAALEKAQQTGKPVFQDFWFDD